MITPIAKDSHVVFQVVSFKNDLDDVKPIIEKMRGQVEHAAKVGRFDFLNAMCETASAIATVYICLEKAPSMEWLNEEMRNLLTDEFWDSMVAWGKIIDELTLQYSINEDAKMRKTFYSNIGCYQLIKFIANEMVTSIQKAEVNGRQEAV